jgi:hypothetical protein
MGKTYAEMLKERNDLAQQQNDAEAAQYAKTIATAAAADERASADIMSRAATDVGPAPKIPVQALPSVQDMIDSTSISDSGAYKSKLPSLGSLLSAKPDMDFVKDYTTTEIGRNPWEVGTPPTSTPTEGDQESRYLRGFKMGINDGSKKPPTGAKPPSTGASPGARPGPGGGQGPIPQSQGPEQQSHAWSGRAGEAGTIPGGDMDSTAGLLPSTDPDKFRWIYDQAKGPDTLGQLQALGRLPTWQDYANKIPVISEIPTGTAKSGVNSFLSGLKDYAMNKAIGTSEALRKEEYKEDYSRKLDVFKTEMNYNLTAGQQQYLRDAEVIRTQREMWVADKNDKQAQYARMAEWNPAFLKNEENFHFTMANFGVPYDAAVHMWATAPRDENGTPIIRMTPEQIKFENNRYAYNETKKMLMANGHSETEANALSEKAIYNIDQMDQGVFWENELKRVAAKYGPETEQYKATVAKVKGILDATSAVREQHYSEKWALIKDDVRRILSKTPGAFEEYELAWTMAAKTGQEPKIPQGASYAEKVQLEAIKAQYRNDRASSGSGGGKGGKEQAEPETMRELFRQRLTGGSTAADSNNTLELFERTWNTGADENVNKNVRAFVLAAHRPQIMACGVNVDNPIVLNEWAKTFDSQGTGLWKVAQEEVDPATQKPTGRKILINLVRFRNHIANMPQFKGYLENPQMWMQQNPGKAPPFVSNPQLYTITE